MKTFLVIPKFGEASRIEADSMSATSNSIRFFVGKKLVAIFDFSEVRKAGESKFLPEAERVDGKSLSIETLNNWADKLSKVERQSVAN